MTVNDDDSFGPNVEIVNGSLSDGGDNYFNWTVTDPSGISALTVKISKDGVEVYSGTLPDGEFDLNPHGSGSFTIKVDATDNDADHDEDNARTVLQRTIVIVDDDTVVPTIDIESGSTSDGENNFFEWTITDPSGVCDADVRITRDGEELYYNTYAPTGSFDLNPEGLGDFTITIDATDNDNDAPGDGLSASANHSTAISDDDTIAPEITLDGSAESESHGLTQEFTWTIEDDSGLKAAAIEVRKNGAPIFTSTESSGSFNFDFRGPGTYEVHVSATDADEDSTYRPASASATRSVVVTNATPLVAAAISASATEDAASFSVNLLQGATDADATDVVNVAGLTLDSGKGAGVTIGANSLSIDPSAYNPLAVGESEVITYSYNVVDGHGGSVAQTATITITGLNDAPTLILPENLSVVENSPNGTLVGVISAIDADQSDVLTYSIISGSGQSVFGIDTESGEIFVADSTLLDFETTTHFTLQVEVADAEGGSDTAEVTIDLLNQASIVGVVFVDVNNNGEYDADEPGVDGVVVELRDGHGNPVLDAHGAAIMAITSDGGFYLFEDLDPGDYRLHEIQPTGVNDGVELLGSLGGAVVSNDTMRLSLLREDAFDYVFAELGQQVTSGDTANNGFWQNKHGQALIVQGGAAIAQWLTNTFGNVFGNSLVGADGQDVADFYREQLFKQKAPKSSGPAKVDADFMALALATFFTNRTLAGNVGTAYGFNVTDTGIGTKIVNVGTNGAAFNVGNGTNRAILQLLLATNALTDLPYGQSGFAYIYDQNGDGAINSTEATLRNMAHKLFTAINSGGSA